MYKYDFSQQCLDHNHNFSDNIKILRVWKKGKTISVLENFNLNFD